MIRSARVQALFSCWASATAFCAAWLSSSSLIEAGPGPRGSPACVPAVPPCHTDGATDASETPSVRASLSAQPACSCAKSSAPCFAARVLKFDACARLRELALGRLASVALLELRGAAAQVCGD